MSSIMTNVAAMTALKTLQQTNKSLEATQSRISTGYKVNEASENAAYWSIATTMRSDNKALGTVQDALGLGSAKVDTAYTGMSAAIKVVDEIKTKLVAAREPGVDRAKVQEEITQLQSQLTSITTAASFSGENWLSVDSGAANYSATKSIVASFDRSSTGTVSVNTVDIDISSTELFDAADQSGILDTTFTTTGVGAATVSVATLDLTAAGIDETDIDDMITGVETALASMTSAASTLGAAKNRISIQKDFVSDLMNVIDKGISTLVDADMTAESTKLQALQTQQQLGIQALSIANQGAQSVLSLFR
ncbi:MAG: flagellin [Rhizobiaceae bacterium]